MEGINFAVSCRRLPLLQQLAEFLVEKTTRQMDVRQDGQPEVQTN